jgi:conjugative relaxase-like TrwC/TraI family protein
MLSIGKIALGQHRYYERQVADGQDDYYSGRGESPGQWTGTGAKALGLAGRVSAQQFNALIAGMDPTASDARLRSSSADPKVAALDLTFSAPKSVSVLFAIAPESVSGELVACHEEAVAAALEYLEDSATMVRRGHGGERVEKADGLIAAAYRHRMSRALDPQLHTHVVAANLARGPDGRFTALHGTELYRAAKTAGCLYQSHLRALVVDRLGLEWGEVTNGMAELTGVAQPVLEHFSKRRNEMLAAALDGGIPLDSKAAAQSAAIATRERKQYGIETHTWREEVRARAGELGLGAREIETLLAEGRARVENTHARREIDERAVADALASDGGLTERENTFGLRPVLQEFASAAQQGALASEVRAQVQRFTTRPDVIATRHGEFTTIGLLRCEQALIEAAVGRAGEKTGLVEEKRAERALRVAEHSLTVAQAQVVKNVVSGGHGVSVIEALAGTGKTYTAGVLREVYESAGYTVLGAAPTGRASRELAEQAGIASRTLDQMLIDIEQLGEELPGGCVVILDEAGMAGTRLTARLLQAAQRAGAKVVAIGDPGQLASVQAGGWLAAVGKRLGVLRLTEVMRQRDAQERRALAALHDRKAKPYLDWAENAGRIETFEDMRTAYARALSEWERASATVGLSRAVMVARENETRDQLNRMARETQRERGALGEERTYGQIALAVGDRVICRRNEKKLDVDNGMRATVRNIEGNRVVIETDGGQRRELPAGYVAEHVEHAYALTGHGMQGGTVESAIVLASPRDLTAGWSYTALSRARGQTRLLIHEDQFATDRVEFAPEDRTPRAAREELLKQVQRRMSERDDEDLAIEQLQTEQQAQTHEQLQGQLKALPTQKLRRMDDLRSRLSTLSFQRDQLTTRLEALPEPRRRLGREHDEHAAERANLRTTLEANKQALEATGTELAGIERDLGDHASLKAEHERLTRALRESHREQAKNREQSVERDNNTVDFGIGL